MIFQNKRNLSSLLLFASILTLLLFLQSCSHHRDQHFRHYSNYKNNEICNIAIPSLTEKWRSNRRIVAKFDSIQNQELAFFVQKINQPFAKLKNSPQGENTFRPSSQEVFSLKLTPGIYSLEASTIDSSNIKVVDIRCNAGQTLYLFAETFSYNSSVKKDDALVHIVDANTKQIVWKGQSTVEGEYSLIRPKIPKN